MITQANDLMERFPDEFFSVAEACNFLDLIYFPLSKRWRYQFNGKSGTTFTLNFLFEIEFKCRFTSWISPEAAGNQHPDIALFHLPQAGLLTNLVGAKENLDDFFSFEGISLATVRNPYTRIVSAYRYLCRSHEKGDLRFGRERIKMNAMVCFDWERHCYTVEGFTRFIRYIEMVSETSGAGNLDPHWMPQSLHIRPLIYNPDIIGRTEELEKFAHVVAARLGDNPPSLNRLRRNLGSSTQEDSIDFHRLPEVRAVVEEIYRDDFEMFEYPLFA